MAVDMDSKGMVTKPPGVPCEFQKAKGGCGVYGSHPASCKSFRCGWLQGMGKKKDRPDKSGIVMNRSSIDLIDGNELATLIEGRPGALKSRAGKRLMRQNLADGKIVMRMHTTGARDVIVKESVHVDSQFRRDAACSLIPIQFVPSRK